ncbi:hypothetical protein F4560_003591 [Saccharothrix ecbatanensis]|uniref:Knr4/Smi1-like domain-containing protein n=1 Tax=Saccharothrix ecbatanensis TaxID=1105145 RepID=A0A7W9HK78_9PSEU|nr:hypothetical protein [Saccharothrix ecbatanensis]MBB5803823.1 hypothetical protein [Saccharothrix ecbatanensis]
MTDYGVWRAAMRDACDDLLRDFGARFGYEPDEHTVAGPTAAEVVAAAEAAGLPEPLAEFYRHIGQVSLPDAFNGFFIHSLRGVLANSTAGMPVRAPGLTDANIVVFGSDGGGQLFAVDGAGAPVYLLPTGEIRDGAYLGGGLPGRVLAPTFPDFVDWLLYALRAAATGDADGACYPV